jgi:pSer/pThr/pTyr-binding forkhead associated (FHA) protein
MDILHKARKLETQIVKSLGAAARSIVNAGPREPIEVAHAIVDAVERHVQLGGRGRRVFPFNSIAVLVVAPSREMRTRFDAVLADEPGLQSRIIERLARAGCANGNIGVTIEYVGRAGKGWDNADFAIALSKEILPATAPTAVPEPTVPTIEITVIRGTASAPTYTLTARRICLGRGEDVRDQRHRLLRTNDVAFTEGDDINSSVSRQHAHLALDDDSRSLRLHDDGSVHGTGIVRDGRTISVPRGGNGVRLRSGDEIVLGEARLRVVL